MERYERANYKIAFEKFKARPKQIFTGTDVDIANKLGITKDSWLTVKSKKTPMYERVVESIGEPQLISDKPGHKSSYWDIDKLDVDKVKYIRTPIQSDRGGEGTKI